MKIGFANANEFKNIEQLNMDLMMVMGTLSRLFTFYKNKVNVTK